jgi:hypothetical protein
MKNLFASVKSFFGKIWFKIYTERRLKRLEEKKFNEKIKELQEKFEKNKKGSVERIKKIMYHKHVINTYDEHKRNKYKLDKLIEGKQHVIDVKKYVHGVPFFYDPEIVQIHNEHLTRDGLILGEIKAIENMRAEDSLKKQAKTIGGYLELKIDKFFKSPRMNYLLNKPFKDLTLIEIRELKHEEGRARLTKLEKDLAFMGAEKFFDGTDISDAEFPADQNIDDFPIIKKILGKDKK